MTTEPISTDPFTIFLAPGETIAAAFARGRNLASRHREAVILFI